MTRLPYIPEIIRKFICKDINTIKLGSTRFALYYYCGLINSIAIAYWPRFGHTIVVVLKISEVKLCL